MSDTPLLPESLRQRLAMLALNPRKTRASGMKGERRSTRRGTSVEFADYRNYAAGDDLRKLDWNVYARLDRPIVKLYEDEEDLVVHVLLDNSASMGTTGAEVESEKLSYARQIAAGVGFVALGGNDRFTLTTLASPNEVVFSGRGRSGIVGMLRGLQTVASAGQLDLNAALKQFTVREKRAGMVFLITDLFAPEGYLDGLKALLVKGHEVVVVHTLSREELDPSLVGDLRLIDVESGRAQEVTIDVALRAQYMTSLQSWLEEVRKECNRRGVLYAFAATDQPLEALFLRDLRRLGVVR
jgi:uncharacterized protein (DUF58 family)